MSLRNILNFPPYDGKFTPRYSPGEIEALQLFCMVQGRDIEDLTFAESERLLGLGYTIPRSLRFNQDSVLGLLALAACVLSTFRRAEIDEHAKDPAFRARALQILDGIGNLTGSRADVVGVTQHVQEIRDLLTQGEV